MKRNFDEISNTQGDQSKSTQDQLYGQETKKRKIEQQRIGDFIVDARKSVNFRLSSDINHLEDLNQTTQFFSPIFLHTIFGENERISGYEGLSVDITLSKKRLLPFLQVSYENKAPAFANVDKIDEILQKQFGRIYEQAADFIQVQKDEQMLQPWGERVSDFLNDDVCKCFINKIGLDNQDFHEQNFYMQSLLPFFIDGASVIEPSPFWKYFLVYEDSTNNLLAFATVFEAHHNADKFRAKISQVFVLPPYQKRGLGQKLYQTMYDHYAQNQPNCFQIIVEDASDDFQRLQDHLNTHAYLKHNKAFLEKLDKLPMSNVILNVDHLKQFTMSKAQIYQFAKDLKLPEQIILRLHELALYSFLDKNENVQRAYRINIKKRYYIRCAKNYMELFKNIGNPIFDTKGGLNEPYVYNDQLEEDPYCRAEDEEQKKDAKAIEGEKMLTQEAVKIELKTIYNTLIEQYDQLKVRINQLVTKNQLK